MWRRHSLCLLSASVCCWVGLFLLCSSVGNCSRRWTNSQCLFDVGITMPCLPSPSRHHRCNVHQTPSDFSIKNMASFYPHKVIKHITTVGPTVVFLFQEARSQPFPFCWKKVWGPARSQELALELAAPLGWWLSSRDVVQKNDMEKTWHQLLPYVEKKCWIIHPHIMYYYIIVHTCMHALHYIQIHIYNYHVYIYIYYTFLLVYGSNHQPTFLMLWKHEFTLHSSTPPRLFWSKPRCTEAAHCARQYDLWKVGFLSSNNWNVWAGFHWACNEIWDITKIICVCVWKWRRAPNMAILSGKWS